MRKIIIAVSLFLFNAPTFGQVKSDAFKQRLKTLLSHSVDEVYVADIAKNSSQYVFLDARAMKEYKVSHIYNAKWIGYSGFEKSRVAGIPKDANVIVYCSVGYRSEKITEKLEKMGYENVSNLYGGIFEWVNQGNMVYDANEKATSKVHTYNKKWSQWLTKGQKIY